MARIEGTAPAIPEGVAGADLEGPADPAAPSPPEPLAPPPDPSGDTLAAPPPPDRGLAEARRRDARFAEARVRAALEEKIAAAQAPARTDKELEYYRYAEGLVRQGGQRFRDGPDLLFPRDELKERVYSALATRLVQVAGAHRNDPDFLSSDPGTVAARIREEDPQIKLMFDLLARAPVPHEHLSSGGEDSSLLATAIDSLVGLIPVVGDVADAASAVTGRSVTGQKLEPYERVLAGVCAVVPLLSSAHLRGGVKGAEMIADLAARTGRGADEVNAALRLVGNLPPEDAKIVRKAFDEIQAGRKLAPDLVQDADRVLNKLGRELEAVGVGKVPKRRIDPFTGEPFKAGTAEHKQQRWVEYQARHRDRFPEWKSEMDAGWSKAYDRALANREAGGVFEDAALAKRGLKKNDEVFVSLDRDTSFIPDGLRSMDGSPVTGGVKWGDPYRLVEAKGSSGKLSLTGNLKAELKYVEDHGGHIELVIGRNAEPTGPLKKQIKSLERLGRITVVRE